MYLLEGLHCESHGMVGNYMYDIQNNKNFLIGSNPDQSLPFWWDDAEPIWVTAEKMVSMKIQIYLQNKASKTPSCMNKSMCKPAVHVINMHRNMKNIKMIKLTLFHNSQG